MDFYEVIEKRRTVRIFKQGANEAQLRKLLATGAKAPSSQNKQSWEFIVIGDAKRAAQVAELKYQLNRKMPPGPGETQKEVEERARNQQKWFQNASVVAVCTRGGDVASAWLAVGNISLAAVAEGLGSGIIGFAGDEKKALESLLGLPEGYELICIMKFGIPEVHPQRPAQRPEFSWLHEDRF